MRNRKVKSLFCFQPFVRAFYHYFNGVCACLCRRNGNVFVIGLSNAFVHKGYRAFAVSHYLLGSHCVRLSVVRLAQNDSRRKVNKVGLCVKRRYRLCLYAFAYCAGESLFPLLAVIGLYRDYAFVPVVHRYATLLVCVRARCGMPVIICVVCPRVVVVFVSVYKFGNSIFLSLPAYRAGEKFCAYCVFRRRFGHCAFVPLVRRYVGFLVLVLARRGMPVICCVFLPYFGVKRVLVFATCHYAKSHYKYRYQHQDCE